jgi:hypothetical protein
MPTQKCLSDNDVRKIVEELLAQKIDHWKLAVSCFVAGLSVFLILGLTWADFRRFIFQRAYPADVVYDGLKKSLRSDQELRTVVSNDIIKLIGERVDSGYSRTFYFGPGAPNQPGQDLLQFYARQNQKVEITLTAQSSAPQKGIQPTFTLTVDNRNPFQNTGKQNPQIPYAIVARDISKLLDFTEPWPLEAGSGGEDNKRYIHTIRISPFPLPPNTSASFELLVLVRNEKI